MRNKSSILDFTLVSVSGLASAALSSVGVDSKLNKL